MSQYKMGDTKNSKQAYISVACTFGGGSEQGMNKYMNNIGNYNSCLNLNAYAKQSVASYQS